MRVKKPDDTSSSALERLRGSIEYDLVPMPEDQVRERLDAEAPSHSKCYGITWLDNVDLRGLLDTITDLRSDAEALRAELARTREALDRHALADLDRHAASDD